MSDKSISLFNSKDVNEFWVDLTIYSSKIALPRQPADSENNPERQLPLSLCEEVDGDLACRTCTAVFTDVDEHRSHYRSDWHRYNLKLKLKGKEPLSEDQFVDDENDISSISGSDSDEDGFQKTKKYSSSFPRVIVQNKLGDLMVIHQSLLYPKKNPPETASQLLDLVTELPKKNQWGIIMLGGGHFAAAIYKGDEIICHKTFHSYTVRAKQGGSQSSRDNKSGGHSHPKSAGASLRRYNEAAFTDHVREILDLWKDLLGKCHLVFYRAVSSNMNILFGGKQAILERGDNRLRSIPFPTGRATLKEVKRIWLALSTIEFIEKEKLSECENVDKSRKGNCIDSSKLEEEQAVYSEEDYMAEYDNHLNEVAVSKKIRKWKKKPNVKEWREQDDTKVLETCSFPGEKEILSNLCCSVTKGNVKTLLDQVEQLKEVLTSLYDELHLELVDVLNQRLDAECSTLLHIAVLNKKGEVVWKLLEMGLDPSLSDIYGRVPYMLATDKEIRNVFRRFMGSFPEKYNYVAAKVPSPLTDEIEKVKEQRKAQKLKQQREMRKEKKLQEKAKLAEDKRIKEAQLKAEAEKLQFLQLSDREKRALAAERRMLSNLTAAGITPPVLSRCFFCGIDMSGKVPFHYDDNTFCSTQCLQKHRKSNTVS